MLILLRLSIPINCILREGRTKETSVRKLYYQAVGDVKIYSSYKHDLLSTAGSLWLKFPFEFFFFVERSGIKDKLRGKLSFLSCQLCNFADKLLRLTTENEERSIMAPTH